MPKKITAEPQTPVASTQDPKSIPAAGSALSSKASVPLPVIPIPSQPDSRALVDGKRLTKTAVIGSKSLNPKDKPLGTLYISLKLASTRRYGGLLDDKSLDNVRTALVETGRVSVFMGQYGLQAPGITFGVELLSEEVGHIFYFDKTLEASCTAIGKIISGVTGLPMDCRFYPIPVGTDANDLSNSKGYFLLASGLDMEVWL